MNKKAFTLVELIVVITILAILGTIAFISFQGYSQSARDSSRSSDINSIKKSLELFNISTGYYPDPNGAQVVTFSGAEVWKQGIVGDGVVQQLQRLNKKPVDPLTATEYTYSRLNTKKEYEIAAVLEGELGGNVTQVNAASNVGYAYVSGDYNGSVAKVQTGSQLYLLAVPTIISSDLTVTDYPGLLANKLVLNGQKNLPESYQGSAFVSEVVSTNLNAGNIVVYSSGGVIPKTESELNTFVTNLKSVYDGSEFSNDGLVSTIVNTNLSDNEAVAFLGASIVNNSLGGEIAYSNTVFQPSTYQSVVLGDTPLAYWTFDESSGTSISSQVSNNTYSGTIVGTVGFAQTGLLSSNSNTRINFTGNSYIDLGTGMFNLPNGTLEFMIQRTGDNTVVSPVFAQDGPGHVVGDFYIAVYSDETLRFYIDDGVVAQQVQYPLALDTIYHVALTWGTNGMNMYINGSLEQTLGEYNGMTVNAATEIAARDRSSLYLSDVLEIDDMAIYNTQLDLTTIQTHANKALGIE